MKFDVKDENICCGLEKRGVKVDFEVFGFSKWKDKVG